MTVQTSGITFSLFTQRLLSMLFTINCLPFSPGMTFRILTSPASKQCTPQKRPIGLLLKSFTQLVQPNRHRFWSISWPLSSLWSSQTHILCLTRQPRWLLGEQSYQRARRGSKTRPPPTYLKALIKPRPGPWSLWATSRARLDLPSLETHLSRLYSIPAPRQLKKLPSAVRKARVTGCSQIKTEDLPVR